jgi:hypothetical protein
MTAGLEQEIRKRHRTTLSLLASIFERGMNRKIFRRIAAPLYLATALDSIVNALLFQWMEDPQGQPYPGEPDTILNILFKGLVTA